MKLIVTAGGQGKKIWPLSREDKPKQFQPIVGNIPLYQQTISSLLSAFKAEDIYVSTKKRYFHLAQEQSPQIPRQNYILEPDIAKDRGPGEGLAFTYLSMKFPDEPFMIIQSDCLREPKEKFIRTIVEAERIERRDKKYMSGGVKATYPIMGIDYLKLGKRILSNDIEIYKTDEFIPRVENYQETKKLINNFHIATHSNHSCWFPDLMLDAYKKYRPDWHKALMQIKDILVKDPASTKIDEIYSQMEPGMTERVTENIVTEGYTILLPFKWSDIGTWDSIYEFFDPEGGIHVDGQGLAVDSQNCLIKNENPKKIVVLCGVQDMMVIDTEDALLVVDKDSVQDVKKVVDTLKEKKLDQYI